VKTIVFVVAALVLSGDGSRAADPSPKARDSARRVKAKVVRGAETPSAPSSELLGRITYDTGINAGFHPDSVSGGNVDHTVGNRFNSALGGPLLMTGMVWNITVFPANSGPQSVSIADAPTTMGTAEVLAFMNVSLQANNFNVIELDESVWVGPVFLGLFIGQFGSFQNGLLGMSDMSTMWQRFHAVHAFYADGLQTMIEVVPRQNAMLRVTVDVLAPVELMDFRIQ
jgi:hypothetical protein